MRLKYCVAFVVFLMIFQATFLFAELSKPRIYELGWLTGCWEHQEKGEIMEEQWMRPSGETMIGMSRTVKEGKTIAYEYMQIRSDAEGDIYFVALPSGQQEASFRLVKAARNEAVFENSEHDFPQRIIYRLLSSDSLLATIEGTSNGTAKKIEFPLERHKCN